MDSAPRLLDGNDDLVAGPLPGLHAPYRRTAGRPGSPRGSDSCNRRTRRDGEIIVGPGPDADEFGSIHEGSMLPVLENHAHMRIEFTLDCCDLERMAMFWQSAVEFVVDGTIEGRYVSLSGHGVVLTLQHVAEPKSVKNRMHLDLLVDDVEDEVTRLETLGASRLTATARQEFGQTWFVLADPEGNEFCVARDRSQTVPT